MVSNKIPSRLSVGIAANVNGPPFEITKLEPVALAHRKLADDVGAPGMSGVPAYVNVYGNGVDAKLGVVPLRPTVPDDDGSVIVVS